MKFDIEKIIKDYQIKNDVIKNKKSKSRKKIKKKFNIFRVIDS